MNSDEFVGREAEVRVLMSNIEAGHPSLVVGEEGVGKTALLEIVSLILEPQPLFLERVAPFGSFLRELFIALWHLSLIPEQTQDVNADLKAWGKHAPNNDTKAKYLLDLVAQQNVVILIDDASGVTPTSRPHLENLVLNCTVVAAVHPAALKKNGTKRFWKHFDEVKLERLSKLEAKTLLSQLIKRYRVNADEPEVYERRVLSLANGSPFELSRLVKYHSAEALVKTRDLGGYSQGFVERDEQGVSLAPLLLVAGAAGIALRYIARAQGNLDAYVIGGISIAVFIVLGPLIRSSLKPRSGR